MTNDSNSSSGGGVVPMAMCPERYVDGVVGWVVLPMLSCCVNLLMIVATYLYRSKLKRKNIYIYLYSSLAANLLFSLFGIYQVLNFPLQFEGDPSKSTNLALKGWWSFRKAFTSSLFLIMVANIGILINAIHQSALFVARATVTGNSDIGGDAAGSLVNQMKRQKQKALFYVAGVWSVPTALAIVTANGWNCLDVCRCLTRCYPLDYTATPGASRKCNRMWTPMTNTFMGLVVICWTLEFLFLFFLIFRTLRSSLYMKKPSPTFEEQVKSTEEVITSPTDGAEGSVTASVELKKRPKKYAIGRSVSKRSGRPQLTWLKNAAKQLFILTFVFFVCTMPVIIAIVYDVFSETPLAPRFAAALTGLPTIYCILSPFLLMKHLGGLRNAVNLFVIRITGASTSKSPKKNTLSDGANQTVTGNSSQLKNITTNR